MTRHLMRFWQAMSALTTPRQQEGAALFHGKAGCADCHSGPLLTDQKFHALAIPPFGPGRTRRFDPYTRDVGRMGETDALEDAYRFRTPSLRNVALTAPMAIMVPIRRWKGSSGTISTRVRRLMNGVPKWRSAARALAGGDRLRRMG